MLSVDNVSPPSGRRARDRILYQDLDPVVEIPAAAALLRQAWTPPCLCYSDMYVGWQLTWAGPVRPRAIAATAGSRVVGVIAIVPRRIRVCDRVTIVYVLSFFAVHPAYRGQRIGAGMAERILAASDRATFAYTAPGGLSGAVLAAAAVSRGWTVREAGEVRTYARAAPRRDHDLQAPAREATIDEFLAAVEHCHAPSIAWSHPTAEQLRHHLADPRGSCLAIVQNSADSVAGALIVRSQVITARGVEHVPSLDSVFLEGACAPALDALATFAQHRWDSDGAAVVTAPNLQAVEADGIRSAGFRATRSAFNLSVMGPERDPVVREMTATNLEVF